MRIADVLLADFDAEVKNTLRTLSRIPNEGAWKPHDKSMPLGKLSMHVARMPLFASAILTRLEMDLATEKWPTLTFEGADILVANFTEGAAHLRSTLSAMDDAALEQIWTMRMGDHVIASLPRYVVYRTMFLNHLVHHRAQLGVYLRHLDLPVPALYGPSADEQF